MLKRRWCYGLYALTAAGFTLLSACDKKSSGSSDLPPVPGTAQEAGGPPSAGDPALTGSTDEVAATGNSPETEPAPVTPDIPPIEEPVVPPPVELPPPPTELTIVESQYWIMTRKDKVLSFNTPWDAEDGDAIIRDENAVPDYALKCQKEAVTLYQQLAASVSFKAKIVPLLAQRATPNLTFLVVTVDAENQRDALRKLDRDAYFWHWNDGKSKPVLSMSLFNKGTWVWEVIASPKSCTQPVMKELGLYLDHAAKRLAEKGV